MAKKKAAKVKKAAQPRDTWSRKPLVLQMRGSDEWKEWIEELANFDATTVSEMAERAFAAYARQIGFEKSRPKR